MVKRGLLFLGLLLLFASFVYAPPPPSDGAPPAPNLGGDDDLNNIEQTSHSCSDNTKNQDETDVDCGGGCDGCALGKICKTDDDCKSGYCNYFKRCVKPTCNDRMKNGNETGVDCGGSCAACEDMSNSANMTNASEPDSDTDPDVNPNPFTNPTNNNQVATNNPPIENKQNLDSIEQEGTEPMMLSPSGKESNLALIISLSANVFLLIVVAGLVFVVVKKKQALKEPVKQVKQQSQYDQYIPSMRQFIQTNLQRGYPAEQIKQNLVSQGWPSEVVDKAFGSIKR